MEFHFLKPGWHWADGRTHTYVVKKVSGGWIALREVPGSNFGEQVGVASTLAGAKAKAIAAEVAA